MMYALCSGFIVVRVLTLLEKKGVKILFFIFYCLLFIFIFIYPCFAVGSYYGNFKTYRGLYGTSFLLRTLPNDYETVLWLNKNVLSQPTILEAVGDSYTNYNHVSALTGLPTVEGWLVHEWLWRGSFDEPGKRAGEVQTIYETKDSKKALSLIKKYSVQYVLVGELERQKYKVSEEKFAEIGKIAFQSEDTKIYKID